VLSDGGYIKGDVFLMPMLCGHSGSDLVGDSVEGSSCYHLESEFL